MAKTVCPRCTTPIRDGTGCGRCGPTVGHVLDPGPVTTAVWPQARRWLDDIPPPTGRTRHTVAAGCLLAAVALAALALL